MATKCLLALLAFSCLVQAQSGLDTSKWTAVDGGWIDQPNADQICNLASAVSVSEGVLTLTARHQTVVCKGGIDYGPAKREWTGGTIYAKSFSFLYGSIEARIKSAGYGVHSAVDDGVRLPADHVPALQLVQSHLAESE
jgi:beta-glucanase (GH16 family)